MDKTKTLSLLLDCNSLFNNKKLPIDEKKHFPKYEFNHNQRKILGIIKNNDNINQRQLAKLINLTPQAISKGLKKLETDNFIIRSNGNQKNEKLITLTKKGRQVASHLEKIIHHHADDIFIGFSDEEIEQFNFFLQKIIENQNKINSKQ